MEKGVNISGATKAPSTAPAAVLTSNGSLFSVIVSNDVGSATSNGATLTVH